MSKTLMVCPEWIGRTKTMKTDINIEFLPRCPNLDGSTLKIVPSYTEAGYFTEANCITIRDEEGRTAVYVPYKIVEPTNV